MSAVVAPVSATISLAELRLMRALTAANHAEGLTTIVMSEKLASVCDLLIELLALAHQYASECGECNGSGEVCPCDESGFEGDPVPCPECEDIRAVIAKVAP